MINTEEARRLQVTLDDLQNAVEIVFHPARDSEFGRILEDFVNTLVRLRPEKVRLAKAPADEELPAGPWFSLRGRGRAVVHYSALPTGHQLAPFIKAIQMVSDSSSAAASEPRVPDMPAPELQVLVAAECPRCPTAVENALMVSARNPLLSTCILDAEQYPDLTHRYGIKAVPATVLDRRLVLIGAILPDRLMNLIEIRGSIEFAVEVIRSMVATGRIAEAAAELEQEKGRAGILSLLQEPDMSSRMGALLVLERALDTHPDAVRFMTPSLIEMLSHRDARIRGDIADLLGKAGDMRALGQLERLCTDPDPDVAEAAVDAVEALRRSQE
jgi:hypothetical protein